MQKAGSKNVLGRGKNISNGSEAGNCVEDILKGQCSWSIVSNRGKCGWKDQQGPDHVGPREETEKS